jgi:hypothetical protein
VVVFNGAMRLRLVTASAAVAASLIAAAPAAATVVEVGRTDASTTCPADPCLALSRTTGYQAYVAKNHSAYVIPARGRLVAWSITLGNPSAQQIAYFEENFGGGSKARISVLRTGKDRFARVVAQSPTIKLTRYFGQTVQFPLRKSLPVRKGYVLALTVPTWAPALTPVLTDGSAWRAARPAKRCTDPATQTAQTDVLDLAQYLCTYEARLAYSGTLVTTPRSTATTSRAG